MENRKNIYIIIFIITTIIMGFIAIYFKVTSDNQINVLNSQINELNNENKEIEKEAEEKEVSKINKRLYSVNSDLNQQRYYLLLDDATYAFDENFLNKKTYILDMNMVDGNEMVKEIDLASVLKPIVDNYISTNKGDNTGVFSVEYFSATNRAIMNIDYEKEIPFQVYYRCINNNIETSLGSELCIYNVENNTIRSLGKID